MRMTKLFGRTLRESPDGMDAPAGLAARAGMMRLMGSDLVMLPLGLRVVERLIDSFVSQLPPSQGIGLSGDDPEARLLGLLQSEVQSHRQVPFSLRAVGECGVPGGAAGLMRPRHVTQVLWGGGVAGSQELTRLRAEVEGRLGNWWKGLGLQPTRAVNADETDAWVQLVENGPEKLLACPSCGYASWREWARFQRLPVEDGELQPMRQLATPDADTIAALAEQLGIPTGKTLKSLFLQDEQGLPLLAVLRGDLEASLEKLLRVVGCKRLTPASEQAIRAMGAEPGFGSPLGLLPADSLDRGGLRVVGDLSIGVGRSFVVGANRRGYHVMGVNYPRDFAVTAMADIAAAREGDSCGQCGGSLRAVTGIRMGGWAEWPQAFRYTSADGEERDGCLGLATLLVEPTLAAIIEAHADASGIAWPRSIAPFDVHAVFLKQAVEAEETIAAMERGGWEVLVDERDVSAGVKFADADLIGCPWRLTVSKRSLDAGGVEVAARGGEGAIIVPEDQVVDYLRSRA